MIRQRNVLKNHRHSLFLEDAEIVEISELKLEVLARRKVVGELIVNSLIGGIFSLFARPSYSSVDVFTRFAMGVDSGVSSPTDLLETTEEERDSERRFPSTVVAV